VREICQQGSEGGAIESNRFVLPYPKKNASRRSRAARGRRRLLGVLSHAEEGSLAIEDTGGGTSATQKIPPRGPGRSLWDRSVTEEGLLAVGAALAGGVGWNAMV
jgi:hypothetical protein